jgi:Fe2+ or Zn2+ uptake regulation protein
LVVVTVPSGSDGVRALLNAAKVRYNEPRRKVVDRLARVGRPMSAEELRRAEGAVPYSSLYRTLSVLTTAGVVRRLPGADGVARFELTEEVSGEHHHHLVCAVCGTMDVLVLPRGVEAGLAQAANTVERTAGFRVDSHLVELIGHCAVCVHLASPSTEPK